MCSVTTKKCQICSKEYSPISAEDDKCELCKIAERKGKERQQDIRRKIAFGNDGKSS